MISWGPQDEEMGWEGGRVSYVVTFEEGQVQVVGHMFCDGRLSTCCGASKKEDIPGPLFRWLFTHCVVQVDLLALSI